MQALSRIKRHPVVHMGAIVFTYEITIRLLRIDRINADVRDRAFSDTSRHARCIERQHAVLVAEHMLRGKIDFHISVAVIPVPAGSAAVFIHRLSCDVPSRLYVGKELLRLGRLIDLPAVIHALEGDVLIIGSRKVLRHAVGVRLLCKILHIARDRLFIHLDIIIFIRRKPARDRLSRDRTGVRPHIQCDRMHCIVVELRSKRHEFIILRCHLRQDITAGLCQIQHRCHGRNSIRHGLLHRRRIDRAAVVLRENDKPFLCIIGKPCILWRQHILRLHAVKRMDRILQRDVIITHHRADSQRISLEERCRPGKTILRRKELVQLAVKIR